MQVFVLEQGYILISRQKAGVRAFGCRMGGGVLAL